MTIQSNETITSDINGIKSACNNVSNVNVQTDNVSQYGGNSTLQAVLRSCEDCLNQVKQGTDKYQQTLANAKHAFEKADKNIGKHFMNSGRK